MNKLPLCSPSSCVPSNFVKTTAIIPCYNTQKSIDNVIKSCNEYVDRVIVIDDGSTDATASIAKAAGATVISHGINRGKGAAIKTALQNVDAEIIVFIDGDGQHNPEDIPNLIAPIIQQEADFVIGSRYLSDSKLSGTPFIRKFSNSFASFVISIVISFIQPLARFISHSPETYGSKIQRNKPGKLKTCGNNYRVLTRKLKWVSDCTSGFTAFKYENCSKLNLSSDRFQIETEMIFEQAKNGFVIAEIPISCKWEGHTSNLSVIRDGFNTLMLLTRKLVNYHQKKVTEREP